MSRRDHQKKDDSKITLPITPMLDMTFQLLFFFMLNFNPVPVEGAVDMALPSEAQKAAHKEQDRKPDVGHDKKELKFEADLTVKVQTQMDGKSDGMITSIMVARLEGAEDRINAPDRLKPEEKQRALLDDLQAYLAKKRPGVKNQDALKLQGDGRLKVANIISVMDVCRKAGFPNISFVPPEDFGK